MSSKKDLTDATSTLMEHSLQHHCRITEMEKQLATLSKAIVILIEKNKKLEKKIKKLEDSDSDSD